MRVKHLYYSKRYTATIMTQNKDHDLETSPVSIHQHFSSLDWILKNNFWGFPGGTVVKNLPANAGDTGSIPGPGRSHMPWCN